MKFFKTFVVIIVCFLLSLLLVENADALNWQAAGKSLFFPGGGQRYNGQVQKGEVYEFLTAAGIAATIIAYEGHLFYNLQANNAEEMDLRKWYNDVSENWHKTYEALAIMTGLVWASSVLDALITPAPVKVSFCPTSRNSFGLYAQIQIPF